MNRLLIVLLPLAILMQACNQKPDDLDQKKKELDELKAQQSELNSQIRAKEAEIAALDSNFLKNRNTVLITSFTVDEQPFEHKIEVRGAVESRKNVIISSEIPGKIIQIPVKEGQQVKKGQVLLRLDAEVVENSIAELQTALELAEIVYARQSKLWEQNIGTEIQYLEAKNQKESLERKLATAKSELARAIIRAPFSGSIDEIPSKEGELVQPGTPLVRIVNPDDVYIKADVSERFIGKFKRGDQAEIHFPTQDKTVSSTISSVSSVINNDNRTFEIEIALPKVNFTLKPNQVAVIKLVDYTNPQAFIVPTRIVQRDDIGNFLYIVEEDGQEKKAKKLHITAGSSYQNFTEVTGGLEIGQVVVDKGYRELTDGAVVEMTKSGNADQQKSNLANK